MNKKQTIRLNESQLRRIVKESVKRVLKESDVVAGTNTRKTKTFDDDDATNRHSANVNFSSWENQYAPDFVQMWADRLDKALNKNGKPFEVTAYVDNDEEIGPYEKSKDTTIKISVVPNDDVYDGWYSFDYKYLEKLANFVKETMRKVFYNLINREDMICSIGSEEDGIFPITLMILPYEGEFLKHNQARQIPRGKSKYRGSHSFDYDDEYNEYFR